MLNRVDQVLSGMTRRQQVALILAILAILGMLDYRFGGPFPEPLDQILCANR